METTQAEYKPILQKETPDSESSSISTTPIENEAPTTFTPSNSKWKQFLSPAFISVLILGFGFCITFSSFNTTQGFMTTIHPKGVGSNSLAILYAVFAFSNFISPTLESFLTAKMSMILATIPYATFVFVAGFDNTPLLYISAAFVGFGAALLWTAHGSFLTKISGTNMGFYSGIFFAIFQLSGIIGNLITAALIALKLEQWIIFMILFALALGGTFLLLFLSPPSTSIQTTQQETTPKPTNTVSNQIKTILKSIYGTIKVMFDGKMLLLSGFFIYSGFSISFFTGSLTPIISAYDKLLLPFCLAAFGLAESIGSVLLGKGSDLFGRRAMIWVTFFLHFLAIVLTFVFNLLRPFLFFVGIIAAGLADSGSNTQIYAILGHYFKDNASDAFAAFKFIQSISVAGAFASQAGYLSFFQMQIILIGLFVIAMIQFIGLDCFIASVNDKKKSSDKSKEDLA